MQKKLIIINFFYTQFLNNTVANSKTLIRWFTIYFIKEVINISLPPDMKPIRVLHVDDEPAHLEITRIFLMREAGDDFDIVSVISAEDALEKLATEDFDVVVSDCNMPGMSGLEFLDAMRSSKNYDDIPFIFFSGTGTPEVVEEAMRKGVGRYIPKRGKPSTQCNLLARAIYELTMENYKERWGAATTAMEPDKLTPFVHIASRNAIRHRT
ncbi:response regulator [Methanophagales archaeon]|nr:MAG: response regulator [Methanophagales archaeon]